MKQICLKRTEIWEYLDTIFFFYQSSIIFFKKKIKEIVMFFFNIWLAGRVNVGVKISFTENNLFFAITSPGFVSVLSVFTYYYYFFLTEQQQLSLPILLSYPFFCVWGHYPNYVYNQIYICLFFVQCWFQCIYVIFCTLVYIGLISIYFSDADVNTSVNSLLVCLL